MRKLVGEPRLSEPGNFLTDGSCGARRIRPSRNFRNLTDEPRRTASSSTCPPASDYGNSPKKWKRKLISTRNGINYYPKWKRRKGPRNVCLAMVSAHSPLRRGPYLGAHGPPPETSRDFQRLPETSRDFQRLPETCGGLRGPAATCSDLQRPAVTCSDLQRPAAACSGLQRPAVALQ